jgi:hypothetical protein
MSDKVKQFVEIKDHGSLGRPQTTGSCDTRAGEAYRQSRAHVLEACTLGLCRLRVA